MKDKIYLSIDLDYWQDSMEMTNWFLLHARYMKNVKIVIDHHKLLPHINKYKCSTLINMDHHSDICEDEFKNNNLLIGRSRPTLNCGTWANHINWRKSAKFIWLFRSNESLSRYSLGGYCHVKLNPFKNKKATNWKNVLKTRDKKCIDWTREEAVGIALSPEWLRDMEIRHYFDKYIRPELRNKLERKI